MIKTTCTFILCLVFSLAFGQQIRTFAEQMPEFKGGNNAWNEYLINNSKFEIETNPKGKYSDKIAIEVLLDPEGKVVRDSVTVLQHAKSPEYEEEALRLIREMPPWNPARQNKRAVEMFIVLPIRFK